MKCPKCKKNKARITKDSALCDFCYCNPDYDSNQWDKLLNKTKKQEAICIINYLIGLHDLTINDLDIN